jgi:hypothetical protein
MTRWIDEMGDTPAFMTLAGFARLHGVSRPTVTGWRKRGYVVLGDGKVDVAESNRRLADRPDVSRGGVAKVRPGKPAPVTAAAPNTRLDSESWSMHEAKRREIVAAAKLRELELAREAGLAVPKAEIMRSGINGVGSTRSLTRRSSR